GCGAPDPRPPDPSGRGGWSSRTWPARSPGRPRERCQMFANDQECALSAPPFLARCPELTVPERFWWPFVCGFNTPWRTGGQYPRMSWPAGRAGCPAAKPRPRSGYTFVDVMQTIQHRPRPDRTDHGRWPQLGCVESKGAMRTVRVVVRDEFAE